MILQIFAYLLLGNRVLCIKIETSGCEKVESKQRGFFNTYISEVENAQCKGQLRFRKHGKVYCLQKEDSWDDFFQCPSKCMKNIFLPQSGFLIQRVSKFASGFSSTLICKEQLHHTLL